MKQLLILIVDDDRVTRRSLCRLLEGDGHKYVCIQAATVEQAFIELEKMVPHFALIDLDLGKGQSGEEVIRQIRTKKLKTRMIVITADVSNLSRANRAHVTVIKKPFDFETLTDQLVLV